MLNGFDWNWRTEKAEGHGRPLHQEICHLGNHPIVFQVATLKLRGIVNPLCNSEITHTLPEIPSPQHKKVKLIWVLSPRQKSDTPPRKKHWINVRWCQLLPALKIQAVGLWESSGLCESGRGLVGRSRRWGRWSYAAYTTGIPRWLENRKGLQWFQKGEDWPWDSDRKSVV